MLNLKMTLKKLVHQSLALWPAALVRMFVIALLATAMLSTPIARAQPLPGAGGIATSSPPAVSHGWMVLPVVGDMPWGLVHIPPRKLAGTGLAGAESLSQGALDGSIRNVIRLAERPTFIAPVGDRVYAMFEPIGARRATGAPFRVLSLVVQPLGVGGLWREEPEGRFAPEPLTPEVAGAVEAFVGTPAGPVMVANELRAGAPGPVIRLLTRGAWREVAWSPDALASYSGVGDQGARGFTADGSGLVMWTLSPGQSADLRATLWRATIRVPKATGVADADAKGPLDAAWTRTELAVPPEFVAASPGDRCVVNSGGRLVWIARDAKGVRVWLAMAGRSPLLAEIALPPGASWSAAALDGLGRLAVLWTLAELPPATRPIANTGAPPRKAPTPLPTPEIAEVSVWTGEVLYQGPVQGVSPVTRNEFLAVAVSLFLLSVLVLGFVLKSDRGEGEIHLPKDTALAEPGRRFVATMIDLLVVSFVVARVWGGGLTQVFSVEAMLTGQTLPIVVSILIVGAMVGGVCEWLTGRTLGKFLMSCEVVRVVPASQLTNPAMAMPTLSFGRSLLRNAIKWMFPPVAALALLDPSGRHRGDQFARALVIVRFTEEDGPEGSE